MDMYYIKVLIAEDNIMTAKLVKSYLESNPKYQVAGIAKDGEEIIPMAVRTQHDVIIMDVNMPGTDGLTAMENLLKMLPEEKVLMFSCYEEPWIIKRSIANGAAGYFSKKTDLSHLIDALEIVMRGGSYIDRNSVDTIVRHYQLERENREILN